MARGGERASVPRLCVSAASRREASLVKSFFFWYTTENATQEEICYADNHFL